MDIGQGIKAARKGAHLTQAELAKRCGMATITIRQYESGKREPRQEQLRQIADALNLDLIDLLTKEPADLSGLSDGTISPDDIAAEMCLPVGIVRAAIEDPFQVPEEARRKIAAVGDLLTMELGASERRGMLDALEKISVSLTMLNADGQQKAVERVSELTEIPRYRKKEN